MIAPSRKIIAIGIVCIALVGSVAYVKITESTEPSQDTAFLTTVELPEFDVAINATEDMSDTDSDGLKDWQEVIQGTDPEDPDSDGDGTKDGEEIAKGRNPLKPGPDDVGPVTTELKVGATDIYDAFVPQSLSDNLSKNLFSAYIQAKNDMGLDINSETLEEIANSIAQEALEGNEIVKKYSTSAIGTFPDSDIDAGTAYGEELGFLYIGLIGAIQIRGEEDLNSMAEFYHQFAKRASSMYVPKSLAATQAELANNFYNMAIMFSIVASSDEDPVRATLALKNVRTLMEAHPRMFTAIANYFIRNDIMFENQDIQLLWENI